MTLRQTQFEQAAFWCAFGSAASTVVSIAGSQILLGLSLLFLLLSGARWRFPPIGLPLGLFVAGTVLSLALSVDPAGGLPQIRKFFVYLILLVVMTTFRDVESVRRLVLGWLAVGSVAALRALVQFGWKYWQAVQNGSDFYRDYVGNRITGFFSHWMTFSGVMMIVLLMALALLIWGAPSRRERWLALAAVVLSSTAILLAMTRGIWIGSALGAAYLLWNWRKRALLALPVLVAGILVANPVGLRDRMVSLVQPRGTLDSNQHRIVTWRTGVEMIKAHPWFGLGPEQVGKQFERYIPADIPRPLPEGWYGHLHNNYLQYGAERGLPTLLALLWMIGAVLRDWLRAPPSWIRNGGIAALLGIVVTGLFELNLGDSEVLLMILALVSAVYVAVLPPRPEMQT